MVNTIWTAGNHRVGDHATPGQGTWEVYFNPMDVSEQWDQLTVYESDLPAGQNIQVLAGVFTFTYRLNGCVRPPDTASGGNWELFKRAMRDWSENDTTLYYSNLGNSTEENSYNRATWSNSLYTGVEQVTVAIRQVQISSQGAGYLMFNVTLKKST